jgi:hypothetical protein
MIDLDNYAIMIDKNNYKIENGQCVRVRKSAHGPDYWTVIDNMGVAKNMYKARFVMLSEIIKTNNDITGG